MLITLSELTLDGCYLELVERTWMDDILKKKQAKHYSETERNTAITFSHKRTHLRSVLIS